MFGPLRGDDRAIVRYVRSPMDSLRSSLEPPMKPTTRLFVAFAACCLASPGQAAEEQKELATTFFVVRHADRTGSEDKINEAGKVRAEVLRKFMAEQGVNAVYSTKYQRCKDTAQPTATTTKTKIIEYPGQPNKAWFAAVRKKHAGQVVLIVGHSNTIVPVANGLGAKIKHTVEHEDYNDMFIVRVTGDSAQGVRINYGVVAAKTPAPADSKTPKKKAPATP